MKKLLLLLTILGLGILPGRLSAQGYLHTQGQAIVNGAGDTVMLKGMGLGGWMLMEGYMMQTASFANPQHQLLDSISAIIGPAATDSFFNAWLDNHVTRQDIDSLKAWGFNSVRLPMHYNLFTLPIEEEPVSGKNTWLTRGFELTDSLLSWCAQNEMYLILDLHAAPGGQGQDAGISDYDPTKPSLWESPANQEKTASLWKQLAQRYANDPWIGGYDLINEPNWNLPGGVLLRQVYERITDSIRSVDTNHILFIEGNWFANDFTGLTPPWDDNMVYSPHKYWSINDQASMQWVLDLRAAQNVPLWLGETGENSNTWFTEAIHLFAEHEIGWAWWPMKKIEDIKGPLSILKPDGYQDLLDYWNGNGPKPSAAAATKGLMDLAEAAHSDFCYHQPGVIDAMFRQVTDSTTRPYKDHHFPGKIYACDYDFGSYTVAYYDTDVATYHLSTGNYTAWNKGWTYRNDGVDIQPTEDLTNTQGVNVGWFDPEEWMRYTVTVDSTGLYDIVFRVATENPSSQILLQADGAELAAPQTISSTGGWQFWQNVTIPDVVLVEGVQQLTVRMQDGVINLSSFEATRTGATDAVPTNLVAAYTLSDSEVQLSVNKPLAAPLPAAPADFEIFVNGSTVPIQQAEVNPDNQRLIRFVVDHSFLPSDAIEISYNGSQVAAQDNTPLATFTLEEVQNREPYVHQLPGRVEAEQYFAHKGVQLENCSDVGGGQNVGYLDPGDYMDYYVNVSTTGTYQVDFRNASDGGNGGLQVQLLTDQGTFVTLEEVDFTSTGGWQIWTTTTAEVLLPAGQRTLRILITAPQFNLNWLEFSGATSLDRPDQLQTLRLYPNPSTGRIYLEGELTDPQGYEVQLFDPVGHMIQRHAANGTSLRSSFDLSSYPSGVYMVRILTEQGAAMTRKVLHASP